MALHFTSSFILLVFHVCLFLLWVSAHADDEASSSSSVLESQAVFPPVPELELFKSGTGTFRINFGTGTT
jgi:hypothetical protein